MFGRVSDLWNMFEEMRPFHGGQVWDDQSKITQVRIVHRYPLSVCSVDTPFLSCHFF